MPKAVQIPASVILSPAKDPRELSPRFHCARSLGFFARLRMTGLLLLIISEMARQHFGLWNLPPVAS
jgi:hypothetical protein